jgi:hypothetical protein
VEDEFASALMSSAFALATLAPAAFAVYPANVDPFAGSSGNFKHQSNACQGSTDKASKYVGSENSYH